MISPERLALAKRYSEIKERIAAAWQRARIQYPTLLEPTLIAVSKTHSPEMIARLYELGHRDFGENYAQELLAKVPALEKFGCTDIRWHFIGHLQTNKVKTLLPVIHAIHTVDSEKLGLEIAKRIRSSGAPALPIFLEVNIDQESSKSGLPPQSVLNLVTRLNEHSELEQRGLMCIPAPNAEAELRRAFRKLRELGQSTGPWTRGLALSMGMSDDFELAIEEGATHVRIGTAIFGPRASF